MIVPGAYSQRDPRWGNVLLGNNTDPGYNIFHYGCTITTLANLGWYTGHNVTPLDINNQLKARGGFVNGGELVWSVVPAVLPELTPHGTASTLQAANQFVEADGNFAVLQVTKPGFPIHFVLLVDPGRIVDPWDGAVKSDTSYAFVTAHLYSSQSQPIVAQINQGEDPAVIAELQQQLNNALHGPDGIDHWKTEAYNKGVQVTALQQQVDQLTAEVNQLKNVEEPVNTTHEATPVPVVQKEVTQVPVTVASDHVDGPVAVVPDTVDQLTVVSTFASQPKVKLDHGAIITDLNSGLDIQRVPLDTVISINRVVKLGDTQYVQTDKLITLNHGISEQYLQMVTPLTDVPVPTAEEVGSLWSKVLGLLHKAHK